MDNIKQRIDCKNRRIESFKTDKIEGIGTPEWRGFILAAETFAKKQKEESLIYPDHGDNCLLCHQTLSQDAEKLIQNYWLFIKSIAEENSRKAKEHIDKIKASFEKLNFNLFPKENTLTAWLSEKYPVTLTTLKQNLLEEKILVETLISDLQNKTANSRTNRLYTATGEELYTKRKT